MSLNVLQTRLVNNWNKNCLYEHIDILVVFVLSHSEGMLLVFDSWCESCLHHKWMG